MKFQVEIHFHGSDQILVEVEDETERDLVINRLTDLIDPLRQYADDLILLFNKGESIYIVPSYITAVRVKTIEEVNFKPVEPDWDPRPM